RVVRASSCNPSRFSSPRMEWLKADCETPKRAAARVKLRSSATIAKADSSPRSFFMIHEFYSSLFESQTILSHRSHLPRLAPVGFSTVDPGEIMQKRTLGKS